MVANVVNVALHVSGLLGVLAQYVVRICYMRMFKRKWKLL